jgi:hypothetical protein
MVVVTAGRPVREFIPDKIELSIAPTPGRSMGVVPSIATGIPATPDFIGMSPAVPDTRISFDPLRTDVLAQVPDVNATEPAAWT